MPNYEKYSQFQFSKYFFSSKVSFLLCKSLLRKTNYLFIISDSEKIFIHYTFFVVLAVVFGDVQYATYLMLFSFQMFVPKVL